MGAFPRAGLTEIPLSLVTYQNYRDLGPEHSNFIELQACWFGPKLF